MKLADVINQFRKILPKYTDYFSAQLTPSDIAVTASKAVFTFGAAHNLKDGANITVSNVDLLTPITSITQDGYIFTVETGTSHDLTLNYQDTVTFSGFTDSAWNTTFKLIGVPNRTSLQIQSGLTLPSLAGSERLLEQRASGVNGRWKITVTAVDVFEISGNFEVGEYIGGKVGTEVRISGAVDIERAMDQYTAQNLTDFWGFIVGHTVTASKDRNTLSDATATKTSSDNMHLRLIDGFTFFIIKNTGQDIAALEAVDICRHELQLPILKSVYGFRFETGLTGSADFRTVLTGHSIFAYDRATIVYAYDFETPYDLTEQDTVEDTDSVAFRDIDYHQEEGKQELTVKIPLDDEPYK